MNIPKKIHQIWIGPKVFPEKYVEMTANIKVNETKERTKEKGDRDSELTTVGSELGAQVEAEGARTMVDGAEVSTSVSPGGDNQTHKEPDK